MSQYPPPPPYGAPPPTPPSAPVLPPAPGQGHVDPRPTAPAPMGAPLATGPTRRGTGFALTGGILLIIWMILAGCLAGLYLLLIGVAWSQAPAGASLQPLRNSLVWAAAVLVFAIIGSVLSGLFLKRVGRGEGLPTLLATTLAGVLLIVSSVLLVRAILITAAKFDPASSGFVSWITFTIVVWLIPFLFAWGGQLWVSTDPVRKQERALARNAPTLIG